ncbi:MAG: lactonase family protein [Eubacteriales bacterium]|nr:lactonase family protein [Eubacteriales bacterium]
MKKTMVFVGTYTQPILFGSGEWMMGRGDGIYIFELEAGRLMKKSSVQTTNASFLVMDRKHAHVYATNELEEYEGQTGGAVSAFRFDTAAAQLLPLNTQPVHGADPCHVEIDAENRFVYCANYGSGSVTVLPIREDGSLGEDCCFLQHKGGSVDPRRQQGPHAHGVFFSPDGRYLYVPDLGLDLVKCYKPDYRTGFIKEHPAGNIPAPIPGQGLRHLVFHPNGRVCYINTEMGSTVFTCKYHPQTGTTEVMQSLSTLPENTEPTLSSTAAIKLHPNGRLLYVSNRGHDSLATFAVDETTGLLTLRSIQKTCGSIPRDFEITPSGEYLVAAHQSSDDVVVFRIDPSTGALTEVYRTEVPTPICVRIYEL